MNFTDISIKTQLMLGFPALLIFVFVVGRMTNNQNERLPVQTGIIHNHPVRVQHVINRLRFSVLIDEVVEKLYPQAKQTGIELINCCVRSDYSILSDTGMSRNVHFF